MSPVPPVRTNVENVGSGQAVVLPQHSTLTPSGRQKRETDSGREKSLWFVVG